MNTSALKSFAPAARRQMMEAVGRKLDYVLYADTADLRAAAVQVKELRRQAQKDRAGLVERVSYTWFNRLTALRFFDARGWHPFGCRVLTPATPAETQPELLKLMRNGSLPDELARFTDSTRLNDLLDGRLPPATAGADPHGEVYRQLILATCRYYHDLMPFLFEPLDDATELLLPDDLLTERSVAEGFRTEITDGNCSEVEVLGWLYQFYISEKKDEVMARKSAVPSEDIPAVTQLFTPHWIVRYLVENSLGRLWLLNRPNSRLREFMPYYVEADAETDFPQITRPEDILMLDPACGSGHMLTYAFDLLYRIYEEEGYAPSEIPEKILTHNLFGLEICPRATQLAQLALVCKLRERSRTAFRQPVQPKVMCLQNIVIGEDELQLWLQTAKLAGLVDECMLTLLHQFRKDTPNFGSLIQPVLTVSKISDLVAKVDEQAPPSELFLQETHRKVRLALHQAAMLSQHYHVVVTNPPYMGNGAMNPELKAFVGEYLSEGKADLYGSFLIRSLSLAVRGGLIAMITIPNWLFLSTFVELRSRILADCHIATMTHNGRGVWGGDFGSVAFVVVNQQDARYCGSYLRLFSRQGEIQSNDQLEANFKNRTGFPPFRTSFGNYEKVPGHLFAYWLSRQALDNFARATSLESLSDAKSGMSTCNSALFLRLWHEVAIGKCGFSVEGHDDPILRAKKWFRYNKGGGGRKWYGYNDVLVNWYGDGRDIKAFVVNNPKDPETTHWSRRLFNLEFFFRRGITWSAVTSARFAARLIDENGVIPGTGSKTMYSIVDNTKKLEILSFLNSCVAAHYLKALSPTLNFEAGDVGRLPIIDVPIAQQAILCRNAQELFTMAQNDWNDFETAIDFRNHPLLDSRWHAQTLEWSWGNWEAQLLNNIAHAQKLETEINGLWIEAYSLQDELMPAVPENEITLARPDRHKDMAAFLSYAVGCMMGRYSLDKRGLILADAGDTLQNYLAKVGKPLDQLTFAPDADGIIPVLDGEWFEDEVVARVRNFLRATFGEDTLEQNIRYVEESLGKDLRKYFLTDFYKDHLQTYRRRPIYWLFQSPQKGFQCLMYLHRYTRDTVNRVLNRYLREYMAKLRARIDTLTHTLAAEGLSARDRTRARKEYEQLNKTLRECEAWEREVLLPLAQQRIELDLDDGVKVNYLKLGAALAPTPGLAAQEEE